MITTRPSPWGMLTALAEFASTFIPRVWGFHGLGVRNDYAACSFLLWLSCSRVRHSHKALRSRLKRCSTRLLVAVKADKAKTLDTVNKGEGGFLDRDLYVFCFNIGDAKVVATGTTNPAARKVMGLDARTLKDATGKIFGQELYDAGEGRSNHRGQLHVSEAGHRHNTSCKDKLGNQGRRSGLWRRLLQVRST